MGDIYKKVKICGRAPNGKKMACQTVSAVLDSGATVSVIGRKLAKELGGTIVRHGKKIEGRVVPTMASRLQVLAVDCGPRAQRVVVDDALAARAGSKAQMILGNDYMQRTRMVLLMSTRKDDEGVACRRGRAPKRRR